VFAALETGIWLVTNLGCAFYSVTFVTIPGAAGLESEALGQFARIKGATSFASAYEGIAERAGSVLIQHQLAIKTSTLASWHKRFATRV
jgi:hypothetical protein